MKELPRIQKIRRQEPGKDDMNMPDVLDSRTTSGSLTYTPHPPPPYNIQKDIL